MPGGWQGVPNVPASPPVSPDNLMPRRAFTLVELLVVIAIMVTLMGLIMGGVMLAKRVAMRAKTVATLGAVATALDSYRTMNSTYPEYWKVPAIPPTEWTAAMTAAGIASPPSAPAEVYGSVFVQAAGPPVEYKPATDSAMDWTLINVQLAYQLGSLVSDQVKDGKLIDAYKKPLRYRPSKFYRYDTATSPRVDSQNPPGQDNYQLWSMGPDTIQDPTEPGEGGDDIPQWNKRP